MLSLPFSSPISISSNRPSDEITRSPRASFRHEKRPGSSHLVFAMKGDADHDHTRGCNGKLVDENMIVLRMRIHEIEAAERRYSDDQRPKSWMEWEKRYYESYDYGSDVCEGMGVLQRWLMETRPSFALAMVALVAFSVPMSSTVIVWHLIHLFSGLQLR